MKTWHIAVFAIAVWWFFLRAPSPAAALAADVASGKTPQVPTFGLDNILDTADAVAETGSLPLPTLTLAPASSSANASQ